LVMLASATMANQVKVGIVGCVIMAKGVTLVILASVIMANQVKVGIVSCVIMAN